MSFSFHVSCAKPPRFSTVVDAIAEPDWTLEESPPEGDAFAKGVYYHPYLRGRAARGIELAWNDDAFEVRILTCSSRADYELGVKTALVLARLADAKVHPEADEAMSIEDARAKYEGKWLDDMVAWGPKVVMEMVDREASTLTMSGPRRSFHIGPRLVSELRNRPSDMRPAEQLLAAMVRVQDVDEERWYPASVMPAVHVERLGARRVVRVPLGRGPRDHDRGQPARSAREGTRARRREMVMARREERARREDAAA